jgi:hypothetical protein
MCPHVDFNYHPTAGFHRRLYAIVYLSDHWEKEWDGSLELHSNPWDASINEVEGVTPKFGTCVMFETNHYSWYGFDKIALSDDQKDTSRESFAIYMYTKERPQEGIYPKHATIYVQKPLGRHIVEGHQLGAADVEEIQDNFATRNACFKSLHDRETKFISTTIASLQRQITRYKENSYAPITGSVQQLTANPAAYPDRCLEKYLESKFNALDKLSGFEITIRVRDEAYAQYITITIGGEIFTVTRIKKVVIKSFDPKKAISKGKKFTAQIEGEKSESLEGLGFGADKRRVSFRLESTSFLDDRSRGLW